MLAFLIKKLTLGKLLGGCQVILCSFKRPWARRYLHATHKSPKLLLFSPVTSHSFIFLLQVGTFIQLIATFVGGFVIAFIKGWLLTLVMLSSIPLLVLSGAFMGILISKMASSGQTAYSVAATVVEQTIGSIRTVGLLVFNIFKKIYYYFYFLRVELKLIGVPNSGCIVYRRKASYS